MARMEVLQDQVGELQDQQERIRADFGAELEKGRTPLKLPMSGRPVPSDGRCARSTKSGRAALRLKSNWTAYVPSWPRLSGKAKPRRWSSSQRTLGSAQNWRRPRRRSRPSRRSPTTRHSIFKTPSRRPPNSKPRPTPCAALSSSSSPCRHLTCTDKAWRCLKTRFSCPHRLRCIYGQMSQASSAPAFLPQCLASITTLLAPKSPASSFLAIQGKSRKEWRYTWPPCRAPRCTAKTESRAAMLRHPPPRPAGR